MEVDTGHMNLTFKALADETRRAIISSMAKQPTHGVSVNELAEPFLDSMSLPAVSKHLRVLERAGLLRQKKEGQVRKCYLEVEPLAEAHKWIEFHQKFWEEQLDSLANFFEDK